jgi:hypothetical protein
VGSGSSNMPFVNLQAGLARQRRHELKQQWSVNKDDLALKAAVAAATPSLHATNHLNHQQARWWIATAAARCCCCPWPFLRCATC